MSKVKNYLKENQIRPEKFDQILKKAYKVDLKWLLEKNSQFVNVNCPACNSKKRKKFFEKDRLKYHTCMVCNTVYISPRPSSKILKEFYYQSKGYEAWTKYTFKVSEKSREKNLVIPRITLLKKYLKKYNVKSNLAIEIGPGYGTYTSYLKKKKIFKKVGVIEANKDLIENCKKRKLNFLGNDFEKINIKEKVNLLSGFEVIEHLFSPIKFLKKAYKILSSNSLIFISCPNVHGFDNILLGKNSGTFDHEHLNYFNPKSIKFLFEKNKFKILHLSTPGKLDVDLVCKYAQKNKKFLTKKSFLYHIIFNEDRKIRENFQNYLFNNLLSGHMLVIAQKKN